MPHDQSFGEQINHSSEPQDVTAPRNELVMGKREDSRMFDDPGGLEAIILATDNAPEVEKPLSAALSHTPLAHRLKMVDMATSPVSPAPLLPQPRRSSIIEVVVSDVSRFYQIFGILGIPMFIAFVLSAAWTFMLAVIQVYTTQIANSLMRTSSFDNGNFWLLPKPPSELTGAAVALLILFGLGYLALAALMLYFSCRAMPKTSSTKDSLQNLNSSTKVKSSAHRAVNSQNHKIVLAVRQLARRFAVMTPEKREYMNALLDMPKLFFQTASLITYLRLGFPLPIIYFYLTLQLANWFLSFYRYQRYLIDHFLIIPRLFYMFDLFFAVFAPLVVLVYFFNTFEFDRAAFATRQEGFKISVFDRTARLFGDPAHISSFRSAFHYLQFTTVGSLLMKSALNLLSLFKWFKIIFALAHNFELEQKFRHGHKHHADTKSERQSVNEQSRPASTAERSTGSVGALRDSITQKVRDEFGKRTPSKMLLSSSFFFAGVSVLVFAIVSITSSTHLCNKYAQCGVVSYQWNVNSKHCTCLMFVDRETAPKTFAQWENPEDATSVLEELAMAGELRIVQIINHAVPDLPETLQHCSQLEQLILIYTKTTRLPEWIQNFSRLEYLHIEADYTNRTLQSIPNNVFSNMPHLFFLRLGGMAGISELPSFSNLHHLQTLTLTSLFSITSIPEFDGLDDLRSLSIVDAQHVESLPSFQPLKMLKHMELIKRNAVCCNGFITGECDLTAFQCKPREDEPNVTCTSSRLPDSDKVKLGAIDASLCTKHLTVDSKELMPTKHSTDELCAGTMYRQCALNGIAGICFNARMQVISCVANSEYITVRKLQIQRGVGDPCDPEIESWLGCKATH